MAHDDATSMGKVYHPSGLNLEYMEKGSSEGKPAIEPLAEMPETCWLLSDSSDIRRFHDYLDDPDDITPKGARLLEMARRVSEERTAKHKASTR